MTTRQTGPWRKCSQCSVQHAAFPSSSKLSPRITFLGSPYRRPNIFKTLVNCNALCIFCIKRNISSYQAWQKTSSEVKVVAALHNKRPALLSWRIQVWRNSGAGKKTKAFWSGIQALIDGTEWTLRHLGNLRTPFLVLHGVEDQMVLVSGSRWFGKPNYIFSSIMSTATAKNKEKNLKV